MSHWSAFSTITLATVACVASISAQEIKPDANPRALDPGRVYFVAWEEMQAAKKLKTEGDVQGAQEKLQEANRLFGLLAKFHPSFQPKLVKSRIGKTEKALLELRGAVADKEAEEKAKLAGLLEEQPAKPSRPSPGPISGGSGKASPKDSAALQKAIAERDKARREAQIAKAQLEKVNPVKDRFDDMNRKLLRLQIEARAMEKALQKERNNKVELNAEFIRAQAAIEQQATKLKQLKEAQALEKKAADELIESQITRITQLEGQLKKSREEAAIREIKIAQMQKRLDENALVLKEVTHERNALKTERDQLASMLQLNDPNQVKELIDEKVKLLAQLNRAKDRIKELESTDVVEDASLSEARTEIALLKKRLLQVQEENVAYSRQVSDLGQRLRIAEQELEELEAQPKTDPAAAEEAKMLREVVAKMRKASVARVKGIERMVAVAERLQLQDPEFQHMLAALKGEKIKLTPEEEAIVRNQDIPEKRLGNLDFYPEYERPDVKTRIARHRELKEDIEAHERLARRAYREGRYETSAEFFETILEDLHPDHFETLCNLGVVRMKLEQPSKAVENFKTATIYKEQHPFPHLMLGIAHYKKGEDEQAKEALTKGVSLDPANVNAHIILASIATRQEKLDDAIHELQTAVKLQPNHPTALFNLAHLYADTGKMDEARKHYDLAIGAGAMPDPGLAERLKVEPGKADS